MKIEVFTMKEDGERHELCRLAPGELFVSAGKAGVAIFCLGKPVDEDMVRQIKDMLEPIPKAIGTTPRAENNEPPKKSRVRWTKSEDF